MNRVIPAVPELGIRHPVTATKMTSSRNMRTTWGLTSGRLLSLFHRLTLVFLSQNSPLLSAVTHTVYLLQKSASCMYPNDTKPETFFACHCFFCSLAFGTLYPAYSSYKAVKTKNVKEYVSMTYRCRLHFHPCCLPFVFFSSCPRPLLQKKNIIRPVCTQLKGTG